ncbi:AraC family transcriptional regulator [Nonomuraea sp. NPDC002799]
MDVLADTLLAMRTGRPMAARAEVRAPWGLRFPAFTGTTFHVVLRGTCWLLDAEPGDGTSPPRHLALGPGDVVFLRRATEHVLADQPASPVHDFQPDKADTSGPIGQVRLDGEGAASVLLCGAYLLDQDRPHPLLNELPRVFYLPARHGPLRQLVGLLDDELDGAEPGRDGVVPALIDAMLLYILRRWIRERSGTATGWAVALTDPAIGAALQSIHAEPGHGWSVRDLAARAALSRTVFAQRFTDLVGQPPLTYLTWWRMTTAARLLRESDAPLSAVARQAGYSSPYAFGRAFRREYGTSPGRYRHDTRPAAGEDTDISG